MPIYRIVTSDVVKFSYNYRLQSFFSQHQAFDYFKHKCIEMTSFFKKKLRMNEKFYIIKKVQKNCIVGNKICTYENKKNISSDSMFKKKASL